MYREKTYRFPNERVDVKLMELAKVAELNTLIK